MFFLWIWSRSNLLDMRYVQYIYNFGSDMCIETLQTVYKINT